LGKGASLCAGDYAAGR